MTDDQQGTGTPQGGGRWDPLPQGDYDDGATAFVKLPEGGVDALLSGDSPLAAPGHGYVPPQITVAPATTAGTDPAATGTWSMPADGAQWGAPATGSGEAPQASADDRFTYQPGATGQWNFEDHTGAYGGGGAPEHEPAPAPGHDVTGQWSIPVAGGDLPDESGEYTTSSLVEQWGGTPPATLPGGAAAPWATGAPGRPWDTPEPGAGEAQPQAPGHGGEPGEPVTGHAHEGGYPAAGPEGAPYAGPHTGHAAGQDSGHFAGAQPQPFASETPGDHTGHFAGPQGDYAPATEPTADDAEPSGAEPTGGEPATEPTPAPAQDAHSAQGGQDAHSAQGVQDAHDAHATPGAHAAQEAAGAHDAQQGVATGADPTAVPAHAPHADEAPEAEHAPAPETAETPEQAPEQPSAEPPAEAEAPAAHAESPEQPPAAPDPHDAHEAGQPHEAAQPHDGPAPGAAPHPEAPPHDAPPPPHDEHPLASYVLRVNGADRPVGDAWIGESLLYVLRERLGLAGAKDGCSQGECGACNVQVDGRLVASCLVPAVTAAGSEVRTVEGLAEDGQPSDVQRALARCGAVQCGFCVPGMAMTVHDLLEGNPAPTELETRQALCGNLCRCSGYRGVVQAVQEVVAEREALRAGDGETDGDEPRIPHQAGPGAGGVHPSAFEEGAHPSVFEHGGHPGAFQDPAAPHGHDQQPYGQGEDGGQA